MPWARDYKANRSSGANREKVRETESDECNAFMQRMLGEAATARAVESRHRRTTHAPAARLPFHLAAALKQLMQTGSLSPVDRLAFARLLSDRFDVIVAPVSRRCCHAEAAATRRWQLLWVCALDARLTPIAIDSMSVRIAIAAACPIAFDCFLSCHFCFLPLPPLSATSLHFFPRRKVIFTKGNF
mgnify:CR=1 FL=1